MQHGFVSIFPVESEADLVWLNGRNHLNHKKGDFSLRYARILRDGSFDTEEVIDNSTCTCCRTTVAVATTSPVVAWRSRRDHEVRDHHIARLIQSKWTLPSALSQDGWSIDGYSVKVRH